MYQKSKSSAHTLLLKHLSISFSGFHGSQLDSWRFNLRRWNKKGRRWSALLSRMLLCKIICVSVWRRWETPIRSLSASWMSPLQGCRLLFPKLSQSDDVKVGTRENCVWCRRPVPLAVFYCCLVVNPAVCKKASTCRERTCNNQR